MTARLPEIFTLRKNGQLVNLSSFIPPIRKGFFCFGTIAVFDGYHGICVIYIIIIIFVSVTVPVEHKIEIFNQLLLGEISTGTGSSAAEPTIGGNAAAKVKIARIIAKYFFIRLTAPYLFLENAKKLISLCFCYSFIDFIFYSSGISQLCHTA